MIGFDPALNCLPSGPLAGDFPVLARRLDGRRIIYLDNAATSLKPRPVIAEMVRYYSEVGANVHRGGHALSDEASQDYEDARAQAATLLGCFADEIVLVRGATEGLNLVASGLGLSRGDVVVGFLDGHHSNLLPWMRSADLRLVRCGADGRADLGHFRELLRLGPKVVAITHCSNVTGACAPLEVMAVLAKEAGAKVVVDASQSIPHRRVDVRKIPVDFLAFSAHKMLGPTGIGVLYGRREALERLEPAALGGGAVERVEAAGYRLRSPPQRFEAGTPHIAGAYGLRAAIRYLSEKIGYERLEAHDRALAGLLLEEAKKRPALEVVGPLDPEDRCAILSVRIAGCGDLREIARMLSDGYGVMCRTGHLCAQPLVDSVTTGDLLRVSAYLYNTREDILSFFSGLDEILRKLPQQ